MSLLRWHLHQARTLSRDDHFCYITELVELLQRAGVNVLLRFPAEALWPACLSPSARHALPPAMTHTSK